MYHDVIDLILYYVRVKFIRGYLHPCIDFDQLVSNSLCINLLDYALKSGFHLLAEMY